MYEFTQDCLTGIDQIDEEHRKLFSLINEAVELPKEARTPQTVKNILEHLSDYAVNHFAHEEAYMEAQNDPELPARLRRSIFRAVLYSAPMKPRRSRKQRNAYFSLSACFSVALTRF